jgi:hypothetical protein
VRGGAGRGPVRWHGEGGWREWGPCGAARLPGPVVRRRRPSGVREACGGRVGRVATVRDGLPRHCGRRRWVGSARPHGPPERSRPRPARPARPGSPQHPRPAVVAGRTSTRGLLRLAVSPSRNDSRVDLPAARRAAHNLGSPTTSGSPQPRAAHNSSSRTAVATGGGISVSGQRTGEHPVACPQPERISEPPQTASRPLR